MRTWVTYMTAFFLMFGGAQLCSASLNSEPAVCQINPIASIAPTTQEGPEGHPVFDREHLVLTMSWHGHATDPFDPPRFRNDVVVQLLPNKDNVQNIVFYHRAVLDGLCQATAAHPATIAACSLNNPSAASAQEHIQLLTALHPYHGGLKSLSHAYTVDGPYLAMRAPIKAKVDPNLVCS